MSIVTAATVNPPERFRWVGKSGRAYEMQNYPLGTHMKAEAGLYIFMSQTTRGGWQALYIGESSNLDERVGRGLGNHHALLRAKNSGATHISAMLFKGTNAERVTAEADLRAAYDPPCNHQ